MLPRLGIAEQMQGKTTLTAVGEDAVRPVTNGASEFVIFQSSEIVAVPGAELLGPLPASIQNAIAYAAVVLKSSKTTDVAQAFVTFIDFPFGRTAFQAAGFQRTGTR
ncbi:MAG: substrate-binding domain-containing protein [Dehalococcoidia bacterium]